MPEEIDVQKLLLKLKRVSEGLEQIRKIAAHEDSHWAVEEIEAVSNKVLQELEEEE